MELDFSLFEPLMGATPFRVLSVHPTESLVALQVSGIRTEDVSSSANMRSAIWDRETHELATVPENAVTLAWSADGNEMGLVREQYNGITHDVDVSPTFTYTWERFSWPTQELLDSCDIVFRTGWPESVFFSPLSELVVIQWFDADKSGLEFIEQTRRGDKHLDLSPWENASERALEEDEGGYLAVGTNLATAPIFSSDGRYIIFGWQQRQHWWTDVPDDVYVEGELPVRVGECQVGNVQIIDWQALTTYTLPIWVNLPRDWQPTYDDDRSNELLADPEFIDNEHFQLKLPTGEMVVYSVSE